MTPPRPEDLTEALDQAVDNHAPDGLSDHELAALKQQLNATAALYLRTRGRLAEAGR